jgi:signal transduction histidine kinase
MLLSRIRRALAQAPLPIGRLAMQFGLAFALAMAVAGGIAFFVARHQLIAEDEATLLHERAKLIRPGQSDLSGELVARIAHRTTSKFMQSRGLMLYAPDGRLLAGRLTMPDPLPPEGFSQTVYRDATPKWHAARALSTRLSDGGHLIIVIHSEIGQSMRKMLVTGLLVLMAAGCMAGTAAAWVLTAQIARRLDHAVNTADAIASGDLSHRIPLAGLDGIFATQATSLNHMIDRMEQMVRSQRQFASHLAHDLRTPLTRLKGLLQAEPVQQDMRQVLDKAERECRSIIAIFDALLRLSEIEAGRRPTAMAPLALDEMIGDVAETMEPVIADAGSQLTLVAPGGQPPATVLADAGLIQQLLVNLLDNVALHTPAGTRASIALAVEAREAVITLADDGPGIAPPDRERVTRPFEQGHGATGPGRRAGGHQGSGLGLAIAQAIMRFHNGTLELADNHPGLAVSLRFPLMV